MQITWGTSAQSGASIGWDSSQVVNPHIGIFGDTGLGKTHNLRRIVSELLATSSRRPRFHIFDAHGDIDIPGESAVRFHESADFGFNPLEINPDPEFGGIRKRIQSLVAAINKTSVRLGPRQERALSKLLIGLYKERGFFVDDPDTWYLDGINRKAYPTLVDAINYTREIIRALYTGSNQRAVQSLEEVNRIVRQINNKNAILQRLSPDDESGIRKLESELDSAKQKAIQAYTDAVSTISTGAELDDAIDFDGQDEIMRSILDRLENLYAIGIYRSTPPPLDPRCAVWRYIITSLGQDEKKLFTMTRLETIFSRAVQRGPQQEILDVVVIDEAHLYQDKDEDHIINKMVREVRKFGVQMIFSSQAPNDYPDTLLASLGTKIMLGIDRAYRRIAGTKLGLKDADLDFIVPMRRMLVQMKTKGEINSKTHWIIFNS